MYSTNSIQIKYRRKIYENVASLAYGKKNEDSFKRLPETIVSLMGSQNYEAEFSERLRKARKAAGLTQSELAARRGQAEKLFARNNATAAKIRSLIEE